MASGYLEIRKNTVLPRLPLEGNIDLTYRCNNQCRHCWLYVPGNAAVIKNELSCDEIRRIVDDAGKMGCRRWSISGGEPMLRPDFADIFDHITSQATSYSLNTNGTLITPGIARLMKRKGRKMVALYGATAEVHDHITRYPGSFSATMRGFAYLREAGAGFMVQIIPLKDNYHQFKDMVRLAESLGKNYRIGAAWLYLSADGDARRNEEIRRQRLPPKEVITLDSPDISYEERLRKEHNDCCPVSDGSRLFVSCINSRRDFHIDPYGAMTFCSFIKDKRLRYDLRKGSFKEGWDDFIPSLIHKVKVTKEYKEHCGSCEFKSECRWCPVYGYLEHRRFGAKVEYLCAAAREKKRYIADWKINHRRYFRIAGITIQLESDLPIGENTFQPKFRSFAASGPGSDTIVIRHLFSIPDISDTDIGTEVYRKAPWAIYKKGDSYLYCGISPSEGDRSLYQLAVFNTAHTRAMIYNKNSEVFVKGDLHSVALFPSDQIFLARVLADRQGCYLHACGVKLAGKGLLFAGCSGAGKSTMATMLKGQVKILCDDRIIIRRQKQGYKIYGTWSHGDVPDVSADSAPLRAVIFLKQAKVNRSVLINDKKEITRRLLDLLIKPFVTTDWWDKTLCFIEMLSSEVPCYELEFDKSGGAVDILKRM